MGVYANSYSALDYVDCNNKEFFKLSDIDSRFMTVNNFAGTVKDFKEMVKKSKPFKRVLTGYSTYGFRHTAIYKISDFRK